MIALMVMQAVQATPAVASERAIVIVDHHRPKSVIRVPAGLMAEDVQPAQDASYDQRRREAERRRLRESVRDLAHYLRVISRAELDIEEGRPAPDDTRLPLYVGELARDVFGAPTVHYPYDQGWRLVIGADGIGMIGESDLAASYALYEVLHRLGCRWYMPGDLGECIPRMRTVKLEPGDESRTPSTVYRGLWNPQSFFTFPGSRVRFNSADPFTRRNRQGGLPLWAGHGLAGYIPKEEREANPEWFAVINGKRHKSKLIWSKPEVADAMVRGIIARLDHEYQPVICLAPTDGIGWDESKDPAFDADDWDPVANMMSKTDRFLVLCNRIAEGVTKKHPDVRFAVLIYVDYTRAPVREPVHPALIPYLAPIFYNRMHPMDWPDHPTGVEQLKLVREWQQASRHLAYYWYGYNLSETWAPNPMITMWGRDLPILFDAQVKYPYWFPETVANFETSWIGLNLGMRLSWDASQTPDSLVNELITTFYGAASAPMRQYWHHIDQAWVDVPDYAGAAWGYRRRFTPDVMQKARQLMDEACAACKTAMEARRVAMADESLRQFERFMDMEEKLASGQFRKLDQIADTWWGMARGLSERYQKNSAFYEPFGYRYDWVKWPHWDIARHAAQLESEFTILTRTPISEWRIMVDSNSVAKTEGWLNPGYDDSAWRRTDATKDTWSHIGYHNYFGSMVYRTTVHTPRVPEGKRVHLWLSRASGEMTLVVNGIHVPWQTPDGKTEEAYQAYAKATSFDITDAIRPGEENTLAFLCTRRWFDEVGVGGLLGPVVLYRDK